MGKNILETPKTIIFQSQVLLCITLVENKSITTIHVVYLPPITGENIHSSQEKLGFQPINPFKGASSQSISTRLNTTPRYNEVEIPTPSSPKESFQQDSFNSSGNFCIMLFIVNLEISPHIRGFMDLILKKFSLRDYINYLFT
jgi:hypothetical protein